MQEWSFATDKEGTAPASQAAELLASRVQPNDWSKPQHSPSYMQLQHSPSPNCPGAHAKPSSAAPQAC